MHGGVPATGTNGGRVLVACLDSMSLSYAKAHLANLPVLRSMIETGALVELETPGTYASGSVWPTFATGCDPGVHGHYYPFQWDPERMRFRRTARGDFARRLAFEPFWYRVARAGVESTVLDAAYVLDDARAPCRQITNWSYQSSGAASSSDPALLSALRRRFGRRPIGAEVPVPKTLRQGRRIRRDLGEAVRRKADAVLWLMERYTWRFFLVGFYEIHRAGHNLWRVDGAFGSDVDPDALFAVHVECDRQLGRIVARVREEGTTVVVCALHGMRENRAQDHFLPAIMARLNACYLNGSGLPRARHADDNLVSRLRKEVPAHLQYALARLLGEHVQDWIVDHSLVGGLDWARTPAVQAVSGGEGYVRLSIKHRESQGFFEPGSEALRAYTAWLKERLLEIRVATSGEPLVADVREVEDLFPGPRSDLLPDLYLEWAPAAPVERIGSPAIGEIHERLRTGRGGNHCGESFMVVVGPGASRGALRDVGHIRDIARFVEATLGVTGTTPPP